MQDLTKLNEEEKFKLSLKDMNTKHLMRALEVLLEDQMTIYTNAYLDEIQSRLSYYDQAQANNPDFDSSKFCGGV